MHFNLLALIKGINSAPVKDNSVAHKDKDNVRLMIFTKFGDTVWTDRLKRVDNRIRRWKWSQIRPMGNIKLSTQNQQYGLMMDNEKLMYTLSI